MDQNKGWAKSVPGRGNMARDLECFPIEAREVSRAEAGKEGKVRS